MISFPPFDGLLVAIRTLPPKTARLSQSPGRGAFWSPNPFLSRFASFVQGPLGCPSFSRLPGRATRNLPVGTCQG